MKRIPEPEIMRIEEEAKVYDLADFSLVNQAFANRLFKIVPYPQGILIDLGCGPGDILIRILKKAPKLFLIGLDGAEAMVCRASKRITKEGLEDKIHLIQGDAKYLDFSDNCFNLVVSNSIVHHLLDPIPFWKEIKRVTKSGGSILIQDLARPDSPEDAWSIVEKESGSEPQLLKDLFFYSLQASFTKEEVKEQIFAAGLSVLDVKMSSDRHWEVSGKI